MRAEVLHILFYLCTLSLSFGTVARAQVQQEIEKANQDRAENFALDLIAMRNGLPDRWAVRQRRFSENSGRIAQLILFEKWVEEVVARDSESTSLYSRFSVRDRGFKGLEKSEGQGMEVLMHQKKGLCLCKISSDPWKMFTAPPNIGYSATDPFNWCLGFLNSAASGTLGRDDYLTKLLLTKLRCVRATETKEGLLGHWAPKKTNEFTQTLTILFDRTNHVPVHYELDLFPQGYDPERLKELPHRTVEKGRVEWRRYKVTDKKGDSRDVLVPVRVHILSTMNQEQDASEVECTNELIWMFGSDVPDSVFADPKTSTIVEPVFESLPDGK